MRSNKYSSKATLHLPPLISLKENNKLSLCPLSSNFHRFALISPYSHHKSSVFKGNAFHPNETFSPPSIQKVLKSNISLKGSSINLEKILMDDLIVSPFQDREPKMIKLRATKPSHVTRKFKKQTIQRYMQLDINSPKYKPLDALKLIMKKIKWTVWLYFAYVLVFLHSWFL